MRSIIILGGFVLAAMLLATVGCGGGDVDAVYSIGRETVEYGEELEKWGEELVARVESKEITYREAEALREAKASDIDKKFLSIYKRMDVLHESLKQETNSEECYDVQEDDDAYERCDSVYRAYRDAREFVESGDPNSSSANSRYRVYDRMIQVAETWAERDERIAIEDRFRECVTSESNLSKIENTLAQDDAVLHQAWLEEIWGESVQDAEWYSEVWDREASSDVLVGRVPVAMGDTSRIATLYFVDKCRLDYLRIE